MPVAHLLGPVGKPVQGVTAYHVSCKSYAPGEIVRLPGQSLFVQRLAQGDPHYLDVDSALERARPANAQSRSTALFAYPDLGACRAFWEAEKKDGIPSYQGVAVYYEVTIACPWRVPSHLVERISRRMKQSLPYADIVREFWAATQPWRCWEFLCQEFSVVAVVSAPDQSAVNLYRFSQVRGDFDLAQRLWPIRLGARAKPDAAKPAIAAQLQAGL